MSERGRPRRPAAAEAAAPGRTESDRERLARRGGRLTRQRRVVLDAVRAAKGHPTAVEIYERARRVLPRISLGTVYRTLGVLKDAGLVREHRFGRGESRFEADTTRHHHAVCVECGRIDDVAADVVRGLAARAARRTGYAVLEERVELYGLCPRCRRRGAARG